MSRKDYVAIAAAMHRSPKDLADYAASNTTPMQMHYFLCYSLADALREDNPRFDRARFLAACGIAD